MIIYINGRGMNAPELKAYISELEAENEKLRAKVESAERQKAEYDDELRKAKKLLRAATGIIEDVDCNEDYLCDECEYRAKCDGGFSFYWRYAAEALTLIGEEGDTNG